MKGKTHSTEEIIRILRQADGGGVTPNSCSTLYVSVS